MTRRTHEAFWTQYPQGRAPRTRRNVDAAKEVLRTTLGEAQVQTALDVGAGLGTYASALLELYPHVGLTATDVHEPALVALRELTPCVHRLVLGRETLPSGRYDLVLVMGVLACLGDEALGVAYDALYDACGRYLLVRDLYHPKPFRKGFDAVTLTARDWGAELVGRHEGLRLQKKILPDEHSEPPVGGFLFERSARRNADDRVDL